MVVQQPRTIETQHKEKNALTPTAALVNRILKVFVTPVLREKGLVKECNDIIKKIQKGILAIDDSKVIDLFIKLVGAEQEAIAKLEKKEKTDDKSLNVVRNYYSKLKKSIRNTEVQTNPQDQQGGTAIV